MAKQRSTFGKIQREQEKREKAAAKRERRTSKSSGEDLTEDTASAAADQAAVLDALARLYQAYEAGELETDEFELRRDELRKQIEVS